MTEVVDLCSSDNDNEKSTFSTRHCSLAKGDATVLQSDVRLKQTSTSYGAGDPDVGRSRDQSTDPIVFTSSPREHALLLARKAERSRTARPSVNGYSEDSEDDLPEPKALIQGSAAFSSTTAAILAEISSQQAGKRHAKESSSKRKRQSNEAEASDVGLKVPLNCIAPKSKQRLTSVERQLRAAEKENAKQERARLREAEKEGRRAAREAEQDKRRQEKELQAQEKRKAADLAEVNKSKVDKKITTPEMIVHLPKSIEGKSVDNQARELLRRANAETKTHESPIPGILKWQQKVSRDFDEELSHWVRAERIDDNKFIMCLLSGEEFCKMVATDGGEGESVEMHVARIQNLFPECQIIYLLEGLEAWIRRSRSAQNRAYQAAVRRMEEQQETQHRRRIQKHVQVDEEAVEDALLDLQVTHRCKIQQTLNPTETAEYILSFTQQISLIRHGCVAESKSEDGGLTWAQGVRRRRIVLHGDRPGALWEEQRRHVPQNPQAAQPHHRQGGPRDRGEVSERCESRAGFQTGWAVGP